MTPYLSQVFSSMHEWTVAVPYILSVWQQSPMGHKASLVPELRILHVGILYDSLDDESAFRWASTYTGQY